MRLRGRLRPLALVASACVMDRGRAAAAGAAGGTYQKPAFFARLAAKIAACEYDPCSQELLECWVGKREFPLFCETRMGAWMRKDVEEEVTVLQETMTNMQDFLDKQVEEFRQAEEECERAAVAASEEARAAIQERQDALERAVQAAHKQAQEQRQERAGLESKLAETRADAEEARLAVLSAEVTARKSLQQQADHHAREVSTVQAEAAEFKRQVALLQEEADLARKNAADERATTQRQLQAAQERQHEDLRQRQSIEDELMQVRADVKAARDAVVFAEEEGRRAMQQQAQQHAVELSTAQDQAAEAERQVAVLQEETGGLRADIADERATNQETLQAAEKQRDALAESLQAVKDASRERHLEDRRKRQALEGDVAAARADADASQAAVTTSEEEGRRAMRQHVEQHARDLSAVEAAAAEAGKEAERLREEAEDCREDAADQRESLKRQLRAAEVQLDEAREEMNASNGRVFELAGEAEAKAEEHDATRVELHEREVDLHLMRSTSADCQVESFQLRQELADAESGRATLALQVQSLETQLDVTKRDDSEVIKALKEELAVEQERARAARDAMAAEQENLRAAERAAAEGGQQLERLNREVQGFRGDMVSAREECEWGVLAAKEKLADTGDAFHQFVAQEEERTENERDARRVWLEAREKELQWERATSAAAQAAVAELRHKLATTAAAPASCGDTRVGSVRGTMGPAGEGGREISAAEADDGTQATTGPTADVQTVEEVAAAALPVAPIESVDGPAPPVTGRPGGDEGSREVNASTANEPVGAALESDNDEEIAGDVGGQHLEPGVGQAAPLPSPEVGESESALAAQSAVDLGDGAGDMEEAMPSTAGEGETPLGTVAKKTTAGAAEDGDTLVMVGHESSTVGTRHDDDPPIGSLLETVTGPTHSKPILPDETEGKDRDGGGHHITDNENGRDDKDGGDGRSILPVGTIPPVMPGKESWRGGTGEVFMTITLGLLVASIPYMAWDSLKKGAEKRRRRGKRRKSR